MRAADEKRTAKNALLDAMAARRQAERDDPIYNVCTFVNQEPATPLETNGLTSVPAWRLASMHCPKNGS